MALAERFPNYQSEVSGNTVRKLAPETRPPQTATRPRTKRNGVTLRTVVTMGMLWVFAMSFALFSVYRNTLVQAETSAITRDRAQLDQLAQENRELSDRIVKTSSVAEVERWAIANGMQRTTRFKAIAADPNAAAVRMAAATPVTAAPESAQAGSLWSTVRLTLARVFGGTGAAASARP